MNRILYGLLAFWLLAAPALAQNGGATQDLQFSQSLTAPGTIIITTNGQATVSVVATGTGGGLTFVFQGTNDGTTWTTLPGIVPSTGATATSFSANGAWVVPAAGFQTVRVNLTAIASGTEAFALAASARDAVKFSGPGSSGGGAVTIADGADVTQGTTTDAACATDNGTCTEIALLKRANQRLTTAIAGTAVTLPTTPLIVNGNGVVITPTTEASTAVAPSTAVATAESCRVLQASATNVYSITVAIAATTGYVMIFNATSAPVDGAVSPAWPAIRVVSDGTSGWAALQFNPPLRLATGATVCFSSTGPFTKTASATAAIGGQVK